MSFDPDRTTVLPPVGYPITEEIPAVPPRGGGGRGSSGPSGPLFLKLVGGASGCRPCRYRNTSGLQQPAAEQRRIDRTQRRRESDPSFCAERQPGTNSD